MKKLTIAVDDTITQDLIQSDIAKLMKYGKCNPQACFNCFNGRALILLFVVGNLSTVWLAMDWFSLRGEEQEIT